MNELKPEQRAIAEKVRSITKEVVARYAAQTDAEASFPKEPMNALRKAGFFGFLVPREFGGMGQDLRMMVIVLEEISRACSSTAMCYLVHLGGTAAYVASDPPKEDLLHAVAKGEHMSSLALGEFGTRSHFWSPISQAKNQNGKILVNASKAFVTNAANADGYVLITRSCESEISTDTTIYYVSAKEPGIRIAGNWDALGMRGNASAPVVFENVAILPTRSLSHPGKGMDMLLNTILPIVNLGVAAICLGIAKATLEITTQHLLKSKFTHTSTRLADLPNERARLAQMRLETDKLRAHLNATLDALENSDPETTLMILESKAVAAEAALSVTDLAMKAAGGTAFNRHLGLERRFRDARAADFLGITTDMLLEFVGRSLCGMPIP